MIRSASAATVLRSGFAYGVLASCCGLASAQVTLKPDGQWRYLLTAGANATTGNSRTTQFNANGEAARVTSQDKLTFRGLINYGKTDGVTGTNRYLAGGQYDQDISARNFRFASLDFLRDQPSNIAQRYSGAVGFGRHLYRGDENTFDVSAGLGYARDQYVSTVFLLGEQRNTYGRFEAVLAEESTHRISDTTKLRQKLTLYPNLTDRGAYRGVFDAGISVAITPILSLTAGLNYRYDSDPGVGASGVAIRKGDASFVTGLSLRFD